MVAVIELEAAPTLETPIGRLLDAATVLEVERIGMLTDTDIYPSVGCLDIGTVPADPCETTPANEVQTVTYTGTVTDGDFTLTFQGQTTDDIAFDATAAEVQEALEALSNVDQGDVTVTGDPEGPYTVTFGQQYEGINVTQMTFADDFTGTDPGLEVETETGGAGGKTATAPHVWVDGTRFNAYGLLRCKSIGFGWDESEALARQAYDLAESRIVEKYLMSLHFGTAGAGATVLTSGTAVSVQTAVAMLEGYAGRYYSGVPTLHAPKALASLLAQRAGVVADGNLLRTPLGSKVVAGGGYYASLSPAGAAAAAGEGWMYATGQVVIRRGSLQVVRGFNQENNDVAALAERQYLVSTDCIMAAVQVSAVFS